MTSQPLSEEALRQLIDSELCRAEPRIINIVPKAVCLNGDGTLYLDPDPKPWWKR